MRGEALSTARRPQGGASATTRPSSSAHTQAPGRNVTSANATATSRSSGAALLAAAGVRRQRENADVDMPQLGGIAHAAVHDDARPAIAVREHREVAADQRTAQAAAAVDDEHAARARFLEHRADERIVLEAIESRDSAREAGARTIGAEDRSRDGDAIAVLVAEVGSGLHFRSQESGIRIRVGSD